MVPKQEMHKVSEIFEERLSNIGHNVTLKAMDDFKPKNLKNVEDLFIITSTQGEGIHLIMQIIA